MKLMSYLVLLVKGAAIGVANIIPGVSGGTMAVVMGIYDRLIQAIGGVITDKNRRVEHFLFLAVVGAGAAAGILLLSHLIEHALEHYEIYTMLLFMGLILGSIPAVVKNSGLTRFGFWQVLWMALGLVAVLVLGSNPAAKAGVVASGASADMLRLFLCMILAGGAMIVPGVSGSLVLVLLGQYAVILHAINSMDIKLLAAAGLGAGVGILVFSKIIEILLKKVPSSTHAFIIGLVGGSILVIYRGFPTGTEGLLMGTACIVGGTILAWLSGCGAPDKK